MNLFSRLTLRRFCGKGSRQSWVSARRWLAGALALVVCWLIVAEARAQFRSRGRRGSDERTIPTWELAPGFDRDCFTFVRIRYRSTQDRSSYAWWTDYPHADWNFSWRLHQLTSLKVDPNGKVIDVLDPE